jgi:hypothetical protein
LDEAEAIPSIGGSGVAQGYSNLAALIEAARQIQDTYFIYATTPTFFDGIKRHAPAMASRVSKKTRMDLPPLTGEDFLSLVERVIDLMTLAGEEQVDRDKARLVGRGLAYKAQAGTYSVRQFLTELFAHLRR